MGDRLVVDGDVEAWRIVWYLPDEGDLGLTLGADVLTGRERNNMARRDPFDPGFDPEEKEHTLYTQEAMQLLRQGFEGMSQDEFGFVFTTKKLAQSALRVIKEKTKARIASCPLPDWAVTAIAAGWKRPKGWKP